MLFYRFLLVSTLSAGPAVLSLQTQGHTGERARGEVTQRIEGCDYFLVETPSGVDLLEWYGGNDPDEGDVLVGTFETYGFHNIYNLAAKADLRVWVEDYWLDEDTASEQLHDHCD